ncbi:hypothetical protein ACQ86N_21315 [Puia sp. P3]|uniref:hypothetical protein n=1 Tax=Puia sp. P3 TaxID=3423952 RepID=UPI003D67E765
MFSNCNLSLAQLQKTTFRDIQFKDCKMLGLHFEDCNEFGLSVSFRRLRARPQLVLQKENKKDEFSADPTAGSRLYRRRPDPVRI